METEIYRKNKDNWILRLENGRLKKVPKPKFFDGQVVTTTLEHFTQQGTVILIEPKYTDNCGWVYGNEYCSIKDGKIVAGGGYSFSWCEKDFQAITDPTIKIMEQIFYRERELVGLKNRQKTIESELNKLKFAKAAISAAESEG